MYAARVRAVVTVAKLVIVAAMDPRCVSFVCFIIVV